MTSTVTESAVTATTHAGDASAETAAATAPYDDQVLAELLVEEISIDGMCGVY